MSLDAEVAVVGAGVAGRAAARELARAGRDVVLLEQFALDHDRGSSHGSSRIIRLSYPEERWVRLAQESYPGWRELESELGRPLLELAGTLDLGDWQRNRDALAACAVAHEVLDAREIEARFPLAVAAGSRGLFQPDGGILLADLALSSLLDSAIEAGARVRESRRVEEIVADGDAVRAGNVRARAVVVTAGAWAPALVGVDATPTRETVSYFGFGEPLPSVIDTTVGERSGYALPSPGGLLKAGLHQSGLEADPDRPGAPDAEVADRTAAWVARRFPGAGEAVRWETCLYTTRAGDEFLLERRGRVVVGSACSGHGFKFAPAIGRRLAALALDALA